MALRVRIGLVPNGNDIILAKGLKSIVGRSTRAKVDCVQSVDRSCRVSPRFFRGRSVRVRIPRNTIPGSKPSTKVAVTATVLSTIAKGPMQTSITVAKRVALHKHMLPVNKLGRGLLTTGGTKVGAIYVPGRGRRSLTRVSRRVIKSVRVVPMRRVSRMVGTTFMWYDPGSFYEEVGVVVGGIGLRAIYKVADTVPSGLLSRITFTKGSGIKGSSLVGTLVGQGSLTHASSRPKGARAVGFCGIGRTVCLISLPKCKCTGTGVRVGTG